MLRIVKTKDGREFKSYTSLHCDIVRDNKLSYDDVIGEYSVEYCNGKPVVYNVLRALPDKIQIARDIDALYQYGYYKDNQGLRIGDWSLFCVGLDKYPNKCYTLIES